MYQDSSLKNTCRNGKTRQLYYDFTQCHFGNGHNNWALKSHFSPDRVSKLQNLISWQGYLFAYY